MTVLMGGSTMGWGCYREKEGKYLLWNAEEKPQNRRRTDCTVSTPQRQ